MYFRQLIRPGKDHQFHFIKWCNLDENGESKNNKDAWDYTYNENKFSFILQIIL